MLQTDSQLEYECFYLEIKWGLIFYKCLGTQPGHVCKPKKTTVWISVIKIIIAAGAAYLDRYVVIATNVSANAGVKFLHPISNV